MTKLRDQLEDAGYTFEVKEEPSHDPKGALSSYFVVTVKYKGSIVGTRSEITREHALERAIELADKHREDPDSVRVAF